MIPRYGFDLLTNLFTLTKVPAVTLPGLAAAGSLALLFWLTPADCACTAKVAWPRVQREAVS
jgi:hypothetical protein